MVEPAAQPLLASASRVVRKLVDLGDPLPPDVRTEMGRLKADSLPDAELRRDLESLLHPFVLVEAVIDEHGVCSGVPGAAPPTLVQHGWRSFLVRVRNPQRLRG